MKLYNEPDHLGHYARISEGALPSILTPARIADNPVRMSVRPVARDEQAYASSALTSAFARCAAARRSPSDTSEKPPAEAETFPASHITGPPRTGIFAKPPTRTLQPAGLRRYSASIVNFTIRPPATFVKGDSTFFQIFGIPALRRAMLRGEGVIGSFGLSVLFDKEGGRGTGDRPNRFGCLGG
jgi:hypothetical protein